MFGMLEALLSFFRRQVGLRTDSSSSSGSLHAKAADIKSYLISKMNNIPGDVWGHSIRFPSAVVVGNTARVSSDTERIGTYGGFATKKIKVFVEGKVQVRVDAGSPDGALDIKLNDVTIYTVSPAGSGYVTHTIDAVVSKGDEITATVRGYEYAPALKNFRICWEYSASPVSGEVTQD